jgi:uncharacterized membrane protein
MMIYLAAYAVATIVFLLIDYIWLGYIAKDFYYNQLGHMMADPINFKVAAAFYMTYTIGIVVFAVKPALVDSNIWLAVGYAALFGFLAYGTYDFTNLATLKDWPPIVAIVDVIWGTTITATTAAATYLIISRFV